MSNLSENRLNVVLAAADVTAINNSIATILSKVPANTTLTDEQRTGYNAIDVANKVFSDDCLSEALANGTGILPGFISLPNLQNDLTVFNQLDAAASALTNALQRIEDAKRIAGHEAYGQATTIYNSFKQAHENGVPNATAAFNKLKVRFEAQGNAGRKAADQV
jgi:ABC-type Zn uptake system ZnuABC Zn-binding protein ZnuA